MIRTWSNPSSGTGSGSLKRGRSRAGADKRLRGRQRSQRPARNRSRIHRGSGRDFAQEVVSVMHSRSKILRVGILLLPLMMCLAVPARAATISLGQLSFDQLLAADPENQIFVGTNAFNIFNSTGDFAAPLDAGIPPNPITPISFNDASLLLTMADGATVNVLIGTITSGLLADDTGNPLFALQFAGTEAFVSAVFAATLSTQDFVFADGSTFHATTADMQYRLASTGGLFANPLSDPLLTAVAFELSGDLVPLQPTPVPEPATIVLLAAGLGLAPFYRARARAARRHLPHRDQTL
jgi:hypothetical protein